jgi:hypothetical protein
VSQLCTHPFAAEGWRQHVWPAVLQVKVEVIQVLKELSKVRTQNLQQSVVTLHIKQQQQQQQQQSGADGGHSGFK